MVWLMPQSVSIPEKTLEHWSSQYVTYRYRSKAALWWPSSGEDIDVRWLPNKPGKAVQLELKTTTVAGSGLHDVLVDLGQLWEYRQRPFGHQPFYVFPRPDWHGNLAGVASARGRPVTELGFARSGRWWWFADWMLVLTTAQVAAILQRDLTAHGSRERGVRKRLVRFDVSRSNVTWGSGSAGAPQAVCWQRCRDHRPGPGCARHDRQADTSRNLRHPAVVPCRRGRAAGDPHSPRRRDLTYGAGACFSVGIFDRRRAFRTDSRVGVSQWAESGKLGWCRQH